MNPGYVEQNPCLDSLIRRGDPIETYGFTDLHIAVLRLEPSSISTDQITQTTRKLIDQQDFIGRTALSWAAELGDADQIRRLLTRGADPNVVDLSGTTPFQHCACNIQCLTLLLEAGANVDHVNHEGLTKFQLCIRKNEPSCLETLWKWGADINRRVLFGTPILYASQFRVPRSFKWLLDHGVDINVCDGEFGDTPFLTLLECSCDGDGMAYMLKMLLEKKPNISVINCVEEGVLHYIARFGRVQYMKIFLQMMDLSDLDVERKSICSFQRHEKSHLGKTALELAVWRRDHQSEWSINCATAPDPDPQAWFADFLSFIKTIKTAHDMKLRNKPSGSVETSSFISEH